MVLHGSVTQIKGIGQDIAAKLAILGIETVQDLIVYYPRRYDDYSIITSINTIRPGAVTIKATLRSVSGKYVRRGLHITEAIATDSSGSVRVVWFNQPYRPASIKSGVEYYISGEFTFQNQRLTLQNPSIELVSNFQVNTARIVPVYRETKGLKSATIRKAIKECLVEIALLPESLPEWMVIEYQLMSYNEAVLTMHFPASQEQLAAAKKRLGFEEVFQLSLAALLNKYELYQEQSLSIPFDKKLAQSFVSNLPFTLTNDQRKAVWQIYLDMQKTQPMNRLLEGDVGSGKTVVAAMAAVMAMKQGFQVALMAPTELLARQHAETVHALLKPLGMADKVSLLVGGLKPAQKKAAHDSIRRGDVTFIIGTHALIAEKVDMNLLGLVIFDEQHRFGVEQRKALMKKTVSTGSTSKQSGHMPHVLNMTATPIPRSLALTLYGELDITRIHAKPIGRKPIITTVISPNSRKQLYDHIHTELSAGRQMFVVCPLITDSDTVDARSAETVYKEYNQGPFKQWRIGLLHGKLKPQEKEEIMRQFLAHELDILVSTTVIEVGVDVPNATVMVIENADRFGLAQIHQLRGRVGRSDQQGHCYLIMSGSQAPSKRILAIERSNDGFKLAEMDLEIRGPGAIYGVSQHGMLDLRIANLTDTNLIVAARSAAQECIDRGENLIQYPYLFERLAELRAITNLN